MARVLARGREIGYNQLANDTYIEDVRRHGRNFWLRCADLVWKNTGPESAKHEIISCSNFRLTTVLVTIRPKNQGSPPAVPMGKLALCEWVLTPKNNARIKATAWLIWRALSDLWLRWHKEMFILTHHVCFASSRSSPTATQIWDPEIDRMLGGLRQEICPAART